MVFKNKQCASNAITFEIDGIRVWKVTTVRLFLFDNISRGSNSESDNLQMSSQFQQFFTMASVQNLARLKTAKEFLAFITWDS